MNYKVGVNKIILFSLIFSLLSVVAFAQADKNEKVVNIKSNQVEKTVRLTGDVEFSCKDVVMSSAFAQYNTDTQIANFQGNIKLQQPGDIITANKLTAYYAQQRAVFSGNVKVVSNKLNNLPAYLQAEKLEYDWQKKIGTLEGRIVVKQGDRIVRADKATYDANKQIVELSKNVRLEEKEENWLTGESAIFNLNENSAKMSGQVVGRFIIESGNVEDETEELPVTEIYESDDNLIEPKNTEELSPFEYPDLERK